MENISEKVLNENTSFLTTNKKFIDEEQHKGQLKSNR